MINNFQKVRSYIQELGYHISKVNESEGILVIEDESFAIKNLVIGCADPILIMEQYICELQGESAAIYKSLLKKNRDIIHGAFVLDETGRKVIFRDTLQLESLDLNELEASINSLSLLLTEFSDEIIKFSKSTKGELSNEYI
ncbi:MAG: YbjN domain-containing protein [Bacteroidota bacterium]|nr:YbjN domain-containing protein [Bacteroidota bacterium]